MRPCITKILGLLIADDLKPTLHINKQIKTANVKMHALRTLKQFHVPRYILKLFYTSHILSLFEYSCEVYIHSSTQKDRKNIERVRKQCERCNIGTLPPITDHLLQKSSKTFHKLLQLNHPLIPTPKETRTGQHMQLPHIRTDRYMNTFIPSEIKQFNEKHKITNNMK